jgi:hypothetical protein
MESIVLPVAMNVRLAAIAVAFKMLFLILLFVISILLLLFNKVQCHFAFVHVRQDF